MAKVTEIEHRGVERLLRRAVLGLVGAGSIAMVCAAQPVRAAGPPLYVTERGAAKVYIFGGGGGASVVPGWYRPAIRSALLSSQDLWQEVPQAPTTPSAVDPADFQKLAMRTSGSLFDSLSPAEADRLTRTAQPLGITREQLAPMRAWYAAAHLAVALQSRSERPTGRSEPSDMFLASVARQAHIPIRSEMATFGEYPRFMASLSEKAQVQYLFYALDLSALSANDMAQLDQEWSRGDLHGFDAMGDDMRRRYPDAYAEVDVRRNIAWVDRIKAMLAEGGSHFIDVGVGHTVGPDSVQVQLQRRGLAVHRVD